MTVATLTTARSGWQAFAVFLVFLIAGPPIGALTLFLLGTIFNPSSFIGTTRIYMMLGDIPFVVFFSYLFGGLQAATVGMFAALSRYYSGCQRVPLSAALGTGVFVSLAFLGLLYVESRSTAGPKIGSLGAISVIMVHLSAAIGSWFLSNLLVRPPCTGVEKAT